MNIYKPSNRIFLMSVLGLLTLAACDSSAIRGDLSPEEMESIITQSVREFKVSPRTSKSGTPEYLLTIKFDKDNPSLRLPSGINIMGRRKRAPNVVIYDDGKGFDDRAGDGVYSGIVPNGCVPAGPTARERASKRLVFSCTFEFVGPGGECGGFGTCPDRVHRSLLWGLIEYDTDILFCVCIAECEVSNS
ncbi:MAG: hypothetical protein BMS9Abin05_1124 [Rhodothermia bacterium]|nr:MAG: hypothetical protein BMS9Abin05_1124 [Rhodothermia bacterium]